MSSLRGFLFDNLGLKFVALLLAVIIYLNAYTDRPATLVVSFRVQPVDLADTLTLTGSPTAAVQAELRGTGKQLIRLRVTEPSLKLSLAGVGVGRFERALTPADLPLPEGVELAVDRMVSPRVVELQLDRKASRVLPVSPRVEGEPGANALWDGRVVVTPEVVGITGPAGVLAELDSLVLAPVRIAGRRDTVRALVGVQVPEWCVAEPAVVELRVPIAQASSRRVGVTVEAPPGVRGFRVSPGRITVLLVAPRAMADRLETLVPRVSWAAEAPLPARVGTPVGLRLAGTLPPGVEARFEPDSVTLEHDER